MEQGRIPVRPVHDPSRISFKSEVIAFCSSETQRHIWGNLGGSFMTFTECFSSENSMTNLKL